MFTAWLISLCLIIILANNGVLTSIFNGLGNNLLGHKCSYFWRFPNQTFKHNELMSVHFNGTTCNAIQFNYIGRHGERFPEEDDFKAFDELRNKIIRHVKHIPQQYTFLKIWKNFPPTKEGLIEKSGRKEMKFIGQLYGKALFKLFHKNISPATIRLSSSSYQRVLASASSFYTGLTESVIGKPLWDILPASNKKVNEFYRDCPAYDNGITYNETYLYEINNFYNSLHFKRVINNVSKRLKMNFTLYPDEIRSMFLLCATELSVRGSTDWCYLLTEEEREIVNYSSDLWDYYNLLYGHNLIPKISCPLWVDVFSSLDNAIQKYDSNQSYILGDMKFGHSHTLDPFLASLELFRDEEPLRSDNYERMKNRVFYASKVVPFGAHISFILYNCEGTGHHNYALKLLVNGKATKIPGCRDDICPYLDVKFKYKDYIENCRRDELCANVN